MLPQTSNVDYRIIPCVWISYIILHIVTHSAEAGICWMGISSKDRCLSPFDFNMSREECCLHRSIQSVAWSPHINPSSSELFFWRVLTGGAPQCHRCHTSCKNLDCPRGKKCRMRKGVPTCVCRPDCNSIKRNLGPFCGTDLLRYRNYCSLQRYNCQFEQEVDIAYMGKCRRSCRNVNCVNNRRCLEDQNGMPHCVKCSTTCEMNNVPTNYICGEDGKTYENVCELRAAICQLGKSIRTAYGGICMRNATCAAIHCPDDFKCLVDPDTGQPVCTECKNACVSTINIPVCGSDKVTYVNYCEMQRTACSSGIVIRTKKSGSCKNKKSRTRLKAQKRDKNKQQSKKLQIRHRARRLKQKRKGYQRNAISDVGIHELSNESD